MPGKVKSASGTVFYRKRRELKFSSLPELVNIIENDISALPDYMVVKGIYPDKKTVQIVFDFNSLNREKLDIKSVKSRSFQKYLGDILVEKGIISKTKLNAAITMKDKSDYRERLGEMIVRLGYATSDQIIEALNEQFGLVK